MFYNFGLDSWQENKISAEKVDWTLKNFAPEIFEFFINFSKFLKSSKATSYFGISLKSRQGILYKGKGLVQWNSTLW
jgi:hypothetical protein